MSNLDLAELFAADTLVELSTDIETGLADFKCIFARRTSQVVATRPHQLITVFMDQRHVLAHSKTVPMPKVTMCCSL